MIELVEALEWLAARRGSLHMSRASVRATVPAELGIGSAPVGAQDPPDYGDAVRRAVSDLRAQARERMQGGAAEQVQG